MSNSYYTASGVPPAQVRGVSATMRSEFTGVQSGFDILPDPAHISGGAGNLGTDSGTANAYVVAMSANVVSLYAGLTVRFVASASNTGASTLNINSLGAKQIVRPNTSQLAAGDILAGQVVEVAYSLTNGNWQLALSATGAAPQTFSGIASGTADMLSGASIASASTINLTTSTGNLVHITGTTTITAVTLAHGPRWVVFDGALTLTHHATNNNLPGAANITTAAGDRACYWSDGTTVYCTHYFHASGAPITAGDLQVREEQTSGTSGGTSAAAAYQTRVLNTTKVNTIAGASLASNQITLPAGTYKIRARAPAANAASQHKAKLYNVTDSADILVGSNSNAAANVMSDSFVNGVFTLTGTKVLELRHYTAAAVVTNGLGYPVSIASVAEVYSEVAIERTA